MLQILSSLLVGLTLTISTAIAQTADPAAPTAISPRQPQHQMLAEASRTGGG